MTQRTKSQLFCKTHDGQPSNYFLADQPWSKFCSECALNMALCGKKIDKDLSAEQFDNKTQIFGIVQRIKNTIERIDTAKVTINSIVQNIEKATKSQLAKVIQNFDEYVRHLCETRDQIIEIFDISFPQCNQSYFEKQTKLLLSEIELQKNLQYIQTNYRAIIEDKCQSSISQKIQQWMQNISHIDRIIPRLNEDQEVQQFIRAQTLQIKSKLSNIQPFKYYFNQSTNSRRTQTKITETLTTHNSVAMQETKQNPRKTQLKLRSKSRYSDKKSEQETRSIKTRKSFKDVSNFIVLDSFHV